MVRIVADGVTYSIPANWTQRWQFLSDITEVQEEDMQWTYTAADKVQQWVGANEVADALTSHHQHPTNIPLSSILEVVDFMRPTNDEWLLGVYIDDKVPKSERVDYYCRLGRVIRQRQQRFPYAVLPATFNKYSHASGAVCQVHDNLKLYLDPVYDVDFLQPLEAETLLGIDPTRYPAGPLEWLLGDRTYNIMTGIVHTGWYLQTADSFVPDEYDKWYNEVPWYLIPWHDIDLLPINFPTHRDMVQHFFSMYRYNIDRVEDYYRKENRVPRALKQLEASLSTLPISGGNVNVIALMLGGHLGLHQKSLGQWYREFRVPVTVTNKTLIIQLPHFGRFLSLYEAVQQRDGTSISTINWTNALVPIIRQDGSSYIRVITDAVGIMLASLMLTDGRVSDDASLLATRIAKYLGTSFLSACAKLTRSHLEQGEIIGTEWEYSTDFINAATAVCRVLTPFSEWPPYNTLYDA